MIAPRLSPDGTIVAFGALKAALRRWIDTNLDNGTLLGIHDPLVDQLAAAGCRVFRFGMRGDADEPEALAYDLDWPTVEAVAVLLYRVSQATLASLPRPDGARIGRALVRETHLNTAGYGSAAP